MTRLRWPEILFIACFLVFGVGGGLLWQNEGAIGALLGLLGGTVVGVGAWLGALYFVVGRNRDRAPPGDEGQGQPQG